MVEKRPTSSARRTPKLQAQKEAVAKALPRAKAKLADLRRARATFEERVKPLGRHLRDARGALEGMAKILADYRALARDPGALSDVEGFDNFFMPIERTFTARLADLAEIQTALNRFEPAGLFVNLTRDHAYATKPSDLVLEAVVLSSGQFDLASRKTSARLSMPIMMALARELAPSIALTDDNLRRALQRTRVARAARVRARAERADPYDQRTPPRRQLPRPATDLKAK